MRPWTEAVYGIPPEQVVGSTIKARYVVEDGEPVIEHLPELDFIDDKEGKPVGIQKFIGRRPIAIPAAERRCKAVLTLLDRFARSDSGRYGRCSTAIHHVRRGADCTVRHQQRRRVDQGRMVARRKDSSYRRRQWRRTD